MKLTLKEFKERVLPLLQAQCNGDGEKLKKSIGAFLKQGDEEQIPVVNEQGEPVEIEEIILVGAPPADETPAEEEEETPAELTQASITTMVEKAVKSSLASSRPKTPALQGMNPQTKADRVPARAKAMGGKLKCFKGPDAEYKAFGFGQFITSLVARGSEAGEKAQAWLKKEGIGVRKAMSEGSNIVGGAFVPDEFSADLIRLVEEFGVFRAESRVAPMTRDTLLFPRRTSGVTAVAIGENTTFTASDVGTDNIELVARKWGTLTRISSELMEDSAIALGDLVGTEIAFAFANKEDDSGFNGDGTSDFHGIFGITTKIVDGNHAAGVSTPSGTGILNVVDDLVIAHITAVIGKLPRYAVPNAKFYMHNAIWAGGFLKLAAAAGGRTMRETEGAPALQFLGYPVVLSQVMYSTLTDSASSVPFLFGDLRMSSTFGDRKSVEVATSTERYFDQDQVAIRGIERMDIVNHDLGDGSVTGPMVAFRFTSS